MKLTQATEIQTYLGKHFNKQLKAAIAIQRPGSTDRWAILVVDLKGHQTILADDEDFLFLCAHLRTSFNQPGSAYVTRLHEKMRGEESR